MNEQIYCYAIRYRGHYDRIKHALAVDEPWQRFRVHQPCITQDDAHYPKRLLELNDPPWILFYRGNLELLAQRKAAVVGSRICSPYGYSCIRDVVTHLDRAVIVSGMAKGTDAAAHWHAVKSIGVLAHGVDIVYPKENARLYERMSRDQLLVSEYPAGVMPRPCHFPFRNRIIAALGDITVVPACRKTGGTMHTVHAALQLGREVYAIPYPIYDAYGEGCNLLIEQGANMLYRCEDMEEIGKMF